MVDWKFYIDSPQERALHSCGGSLTEGWGWGDGDGYYNGPHDSDGYGDGYGNGYGDGYSHGFDGDGRSSKKW